MCLFSITCWLVPGSSQPFRQRAKEVSPKIKRPEPRANYSPPSSTEVKNEWSYISTPLLVFMSCTGTTLPLNSPFISCLLDGLWKHRVCLYVKWVVAQTDYCLSRISTHPRLRKHTVSALLYRLSYRTVICIVSSICLSPFFRCYECISISRGFVRPTQTEQTDTHWLGCCTDTHGQDTRVETCTPRQ